MNQRIQPALKVLCVFALGMQYLGSNAEARFTYPDEWRALYPNSTAIQVSSDGCQLCHRDASGGDPWNGYGWRIRQVFLGLGNNPDIADAIVEAEAIDLDEDPSDRSSLDEINYNFQPGWTAGSNNTIYFENGTTQTDQAPPGDLVYDFTDLDWPTASITDPIPGPIPNGMVSVSTEEIATGFNAPLKAVKAPGIDGSLFVVEQTGKIFRVDLATGEKTLFHDVSSQLIPFGAQGYDERGLLGLAFHPNYASTGLFYTYQSVPENTGELSFPALQSPNHRSVIAAYRSSQPSCNSSITKLGNVMVFDQPRANHNGGDLAFGADGFLYISVGDGGGQDDANQGENGLGNGRDTTTPLGTIMRINPTGSNSNSGTYGIPATNPFVGANDGSLEEIYAYGFRNPYRISFDAMTGELYAADVGQNEIEEIDLVVNGGNYGWNRKEGSFFFYNPSNGSSFISTIAPPAQPSDLIDPIAQYDHDEGRSVTGGYVYRGSQIAGLQGRYVFADYFRRLFYLDGSNTIRNFSTGSQTSDLIAGFGQDADSELYILTNETFNPNAVTGKLLKLIPLGGSAIAPDSEGESALCPPSEDFCTPIVANNGRIAFVCL